MGHLLRAKFGLSARHDFSPAGFGVSIAGAAVLVAAFGLRAFRLADHNIWYDEAFTLGVARLGFLGAAARTAADTHPPLYYWLLGVWEPLAGGEPFSLRFLTVVLSVPAVAASMVLGRRAFGPAGAIWAGLFLALNPLHLRWSQEVRMHGPALTFGLIGLYFGHRWLTDSKARRPDLVGYALGLFAAAFTVYLTAAVPLLAGLWAWGNRRGRAWVLASLGVFGLIVPWLGFALTCQRSWAAGPAAPLPELLRALPAGLIFGRGEVDSFWPLAALAAAAGVLGGLTCPAGRKFAAGAVLMAGLGLLVLVPRPFGYVPVYDPRYFLSAVPLLGLTLAAAASGRPRFLAAGLAVGVLGLLFVGTWQYLESRRLTDDYLTLFRVLRAHVVPGDRAVLVSGDRLPIFEYYARRAGLMDLGVIPVSPRTNPGWRAQVDGLVGRFWLILMEPGIEDPAGEVSAYLRSRFAEAARFMFGYNGAILFDPSGQHPMPARLEPEVRVDGPGALFGYDPPIGRARPGDRVYLVVYQGPAAAPARVELVDPAGKIRQVWNLGPPRAADLGLISLTVEPGLPPGPYAWVFRARGEARRLGELLVEGTRPPSGPPGSPARTLDIRFGDGITLTGADLSPAEVRPGEAVAVRLYWAVVDKPTDDWQVFIHVVPAPGTPPAAQADFRPAGGLLPTYQWAPGDRFTDEAVVRLPASLVPGEYYVIAGLYRLADGLRNLTGKGETFALLGRIVVTER
jgi:hypothetical protein